MIKAYNFFDFEKANQSFSSGLEETVNHLNFLDMLLKAHMESGYLYAKSQITRQTEERPEQSQPYEEIRQELGRGLSYILARCERTSEENKTLSVDGGIPLSFFLDRFNCHGYSYLCVLLATAPCFDESYCDKYNILRNNKKGHGLPTFALADVLYGYLADEEQLIQAMKTRYDLEYCPLIHINRCPDGASSLEDSFCADRQFIELLKGEMLLPEDMAMCAYEYDMSGDHVIRQEMTSSFSHILSSQPNQFMIFHVSGRPGSGRKHLISKATKKDGILVFSLENFLHQNREDSELILKEIIVRCASLNLELILDDCDKLESNETYLLHFIRKFSFYLNRVIIVSDSSYQLKRCLRQYLFYEIKLPDPSTEEQFRLWKYYLGALSGLTDTEVEILSSLYNLLPGQIVEIAAKMSMNAIVNQHLIEIDEIKRAVKDLNSDRIQKLATLLKGPYSFEDLKLNYDAKERLKLACSRVKNRSLVEDQWGFGEKRSYGRGTSMVMFGPPGTGKTMSAIVIANELGMDLYRIDLSQMIDKYIGETEKNLGMVFDAAKEGNYILFFDEADSLFSKRTQTQSSNDKHANNEVSYLLQKMEQYDGISILATNKFNNIDPAFIRRITYVVNLELPDEDQRLEMFLANLPEKAPKAPDLDLEFFASRFDMSGSMIKNVMINAAYYAATSDGIFSNEHLVNATYDEFKKNGRMLSFEDFEAYGMYLHRRS